MAESVDLSREAGKENEETLADLSPAGKATSKDEVEIEKCLQDQDFLRNTFTELHESHYFGQLNLSYQLNPKQNFVLLFKTISGCPPKSGPASLGSPVNLPFIFCG